MKEKFKVTMTIEGSGRTTLVETEDKLVAFNAVFNFRDATKKMAERCGANDVRCTDFNDGEIVDWSIGGVFHMVVLRVESI